MIVGCYTLHLYCDNGGDEFGTNCPNRSIVYNAAEFTGPDKKTCLSEARKLGWSFNLNRTKAHCPRCTKAGMKL